MPRNFISKQSSLAASVGIAPVQQRARRAVAAQFFQEHLYEKGAPWDEVRRILQCIDYGRPVLVGPLPPAPGRLVTIGADELLGRGFFAETAAPSREGGIGRETNEKWWRIAPEAPYLKWYGPPGPDAFRLGTPDPVRYFVPAARQELWLLARPDVS